MEMVTFSLFDRKYTFWANLDQRIKIVILSWNLVPRLIRICIIQWRWSLFLFSIRYMLLGKFGQAIQNHQFKLKEMWCLDWFGHAEFNGGFSFWYFRPRIPSWDWFEYLEFNGSVLFFCFQPASLVQNIQSISE